MNSAWIEMLLTDFPTDEKRIDCQVNCKDKFFNGRTNRLFDDFERMVSDRQLNFVTEAFQSFFNDIQPGYRDMPELNKLTPQDEANIKCWISSIADLACLNLFDAETKELDLTLLRFIGLEQYASKINKADLVCAYIGSVTQQMMKSTNVVDLISEKPAVFSAVCGYLNGHYRQWALQEMKRQGIKANDAFIPPGKPMGILASPAAKSAIGVGILGAAIGIGLAIFKACEVFSKDAASPQIKHKRSR